MKKLNLLILLPAISFSLIGCNEMESVKPSVSSSLGSGNAGTGGDSGNGGVSVEVPADANVDMEALNKEIDGLELALADVEGEIAKIDIPYLTAGSSGQQSLTKSLQNLFNKLYDAVVKVVGQTDRLRAEVNERIAKLDPTNPLHVIAIIKLREAMAYLDQLDARVSEKMDSVVAKINQMLAKVDAKIASMDQGNPLTWFAMIYWEQVKAVVIEFRNKLDAL